MNPTHSSHSKIASPSIYMAMRVEFLRETFILTRQDLLHIIDAIYTELSQSDLLDQMSVNFIVLNTHERQFLETLVVSHGMMAFSEKNSIRKITRNGPQPAVSSQIPEPRDLETARLRISYTDGVLHADKSSFKLDSHPHVFLNISHHRELHTTFADIDDFITISSSVKKPLTHLEASVNELYNKIINENQKIDDKFCTRAFLRQCFGRLVSTLEADADGRSNKRPFLLALKDVADGDDNMEDANMDEYNPLDTVMRETKSMSKGPETTVSTRDNDLRPNTKKLKTEASSRPISILTPVQGNQYMSMKNAEPLAIEAAKDDESVLVGIKVPQTQKRNSAPKKKPSAATTASNVSHPDSASEQDVQLDEKEKGKGKDKKQNQRQTRSRGPVQAQPHSLSQTQAQNQTEVQSQSQSEATVKKDSLVSATKQDAKKSKNLSKSTSVAAVKSGKKQDNNVKMPIPSSEKQTKKQIKMEIEQVATKTQKSKKSAQQLQLQQQPQVPTISQLHAQSMNVDEGTIGGYPKVKKIINESLQKTQSQEQRQANAVTQPLPVTRTLRNTIANTVANANANANTNANTNLNTNVKASQPAPATVTGERESPFTGVFNAFSSLSANAPKTQIGQNSLLHTLAGHSKQGQGQGQGQGQEQGQEQMPEIEVINSPVSISSSNLGSVGKDGTGASAGAGTNNKKPVKNQGQLNQYGNGNSAYTPITIPPGGDPNDSIVISDGTTALSQTSTRAQTNGQHLQNQTPPPQYQPLYQPQYQSQTQTQPQYQPQYTPQTQAYSQHQHQHQQQQQQQNRRMPVVQAQPYPKIPGNQGQLGQVQQNMNQTQLAGQVQNRTQSQIQADKKLRARAEIEKQARDTLVPEFRSILKSVNDQSRYAKIADADDLAANMYAFCMGDERVMRIRKTFPVSKPIFTNIAQEVNFACGTGGSDNPHFERAQFQFYCLVNYFSYVDEQKNNPRNIPNISMENVEIDIPTLVNNIVNPISDSFLTAELSRTGNFQTLVPPKTTTVAAAAAATAAKTDIDTAKFYPVLIGNEAFSVIFINCEQTSYVFVQDPMIVQEQALKDDMAREEPQFNSTIFLKQLHAKLLEMGLHWHNIVAVSLLGQIPIQYPADTVFYTLQYIRILACTHELFDIIQRRMTAAGIHHNAQMEYRHEVMKGYEWITANQEEMLINAVQQGNTRLLQLMLWIRFVANKFFKLRDDAYVQDQTQDQDHHQNQNQNQTQDQNQNQNQNQNQGQEPGQGQGQGQPQSQPQSQTEDQGQDQNQSQNQC